MSCRSALVAWAAPRGRAQDRGVEQPVGRQTAAVDLEPHGLGGAPVGHEDRCAVPVGVEGRGGVDHRHASVACGVQLVAGRDDLQDLTAGEPTHLLERVRDGLLPGVAVLLAADQTEHVHQLGLTADGDAITVPQQGVQQGPDHDRVGDAVLALPQPRVEGPGGLLRQVVSTALPRVDDVPLVEGQVDRRTVTTAGLDRIGRRDHRLDEVVHVHRGRQEAGGVAVLLAVVDVQRDVVDLVVALGEDLVLPAAEGGHLRVGRAARHQLDGRVDQPHRPARLGGQPTVLVRGLVADLPRSVHLVAQAPEPVTEGILGPVGDPSIRPVGATRVVGVLQQVAGFLQPPGAQVDRHHHLGVDGLRPGVELVQSDGVRLGRSPGQVEPGRALVEGADAVLPAVAGDEVATRVAHHGGSDLPRQLEDVGPPPVRVGARVGRLVDAGVDAAAHVLDEGAEQPTRHRRQRKSGVQDQPGSGHA